MEATYYTKDLTQIYQTLNTNPDQGLSTGEVDERIAEVGYNEIPKVSKGFFKIYLAPLFNWLIVIYLLLTVVMLIFLAIGWDADLTTVGMTLFIVFLNCVIAIVQQYRATKKLNALRELSAPMTTVLRDGNKIDTDSRNVVPGDILIISQGDKIPADARIISASNLEVNESSLTGESEPAKKLSDGSRLETNEEIPIGSRKNMVFFGTFITTGNGKAIVVKTGADTEIGRLSFELEQAGTSEIPIRQKMNHFGKWLGLGTILLWIILIIYQSIRWGIQVALEVENPQILDLVGSLNAALDILPINLPLLTTIVLLTGLVAMARSGVIVRNLASVDSLGRVSVVCSDKTGTLTKNQMSVQHIWTNGSIFKVSGSGYSPEGQIININDPKNLIYVKHVENHPELKLLLISSFLNNNSALVKNELEVGSRVIDTWSVVGSPTEGALMVLFQKGMGDYLLEDYKEIKEYPFDSSIKRMTKIYQKSEKHYSFTKGASEVLIPLCSKILYKNANIEFTEDLKNQVTEKVNYFAEQGYRILSLCYKEFYALPSHTDEDRDYFESDLIYLGFVTILDPPREKVKDSVESCHNAGVDVVMITGDSPKTATSISRKISIIKDENDLVCEGKDIKEMIKSPDFDKIKVFARVSPEHKQDIVNKYKEEGKVVAMTGDGVNDALALNLADAGIAMGITGTDVAKEASDMVISDDSFNSIVTGIEQGRGIFAKIRAIIVFFVCTNVFEGIAQILLYVILGLPYFFDPQYLMMWFFISIIIHALPSFGMVLDDIPKEVMDEKPKDSEEILSRNTLLLMFPFGILLAISMMTIYFISYSGLWPLFKANTEFGDLNYAYLYTVETIIPGTNLIVAKTLTMLIAVILICEVFLILQIRRPNKSLLKSILQDSNKWIFLTLGLIIFCFFALMYIPGVQTSITLNSRTFSFMFLTGEDWIVCILVSMICVGGFEIYKFICRKKGIVF